MDSDLVWDAHLLDALVTSGMLDVDAPARDAAAGDASAREPAVAQGPSADTARYLDHWRP